MVKIMVELAEDELVKALRALPPEKLKTILQKTGLTERPELRWIEASELDNLTALISVGGDAIRDTEMLYHA